MKVTTYKTVYDNSLCCHCDEDDCELNHRPEIKFQVKGGRFTSKGVKEVSQHFFGIACKNCYLLKEVKISEKIYVSCGEGNTCLRGMDCEGGRT